MGVRGLGELMEKGGRGGGGREGEEGGEGREGGREREGNREGGRYCGHYKDCAIFYLIIAHLAIIPHWHLETNSCYNEYTMYNVHLHTCTG